MPHSFDDQETEFMDGRRRAGEFRPRIGQELPLPWLLGIIAIIGAQAVAVYYQVARQGELVADLIKQVSQLSSDIGAKNLKDVEHDMRLADHDRRMLTIESLTRKPP